MAPPGSVLEDPAPSRSLQRLLAHYPQLAPVESAWPLPRRVRNENYRVRAGGRDWVVKRYTSPRAPQLLELPHAIERQLAATAFPVARIERTATGGTLVHHDAAHYSVHEWVSGDQFSIDQRTWLLARRPQLADDLAARLAQLHAVTLGLRDHRAADVAALLDQPRRTAARLRRFRLPRPSLLRALRMTPRKTSFDQWILTTVPEIEARARQLADGALRGGRLTAALSTAEPVVLHNDVNWENLVFDEEPRLRALLDFDNAILGPRALEVGAAAVVLVGTDEGQLGRFLDAYQRAAGVQTDRELVELAMVLKCVRSILWSIHTYLSHDRSRDDSPDAALLESWCRHLHASLRELG